MTIVVGGGLAGLTAAALLARDGVSVTVYEKARSVGGRAQSVQREGFTFNIGAHALYHTGPGVDVLKGLGVTLKGKRPTLRARFLYEGGVYRMGQLVPVLGGVLRFPQLVLKIASLNPEAYRTVTVDEWLAQHTAHPGLCAALKGLVNTLTYINAPGTLDMATVITQTRLFLRGNVLYLDGGWQTIVDQLRAIAQGHGARIVEGERVEQICCDHRVTGVRLASGEATPAERVILAVPPQEAAALTGLPALQQRADDAIPARVDSLDVALRKLPDPSVTFGLDVDHAMYLSVHSASADLAPGDGALIHVMRYLPTGETGSRQALEAVLDALQPGWRGEVVFARYLPEMIVTHDTPRAATGGQPGRTPVSTGVEGLTLAGDWVGGEGLLANASFASAICAVQREHTLEPH